MGRANWINETLGGRYKIEELLGQGGMSSVYRALDPNLQRVVAIKMIHPHLSTDPKFMARFEEEARAVARLRHPNIVQVFDFNKDDDVYYMVQEFVAGETLQAALRRLNQSGQRMPLKEVVRYTMNVCSAIGYAHQYGMIHRDIKPANIMLDEHGQAILMDFGIVKLLGGQSHTTTGSVVGTVLYMSPEMLRGEPPDPRADIYSLGVTLFEMLSGRPPFEASSAMTLMMMHQNDPVPDMHHIRPETPDDLITIVEKALAKNPADRFSSAADMIAALKKVYDRLTNTQPATLIQQGSPASALPRPQPTVRVSAEQAASGQVRPVSGQTQPASQQDPPVPSRGQTASAPAGMGARPNAGTGTSQASQYPTGPSTTGAQPQPAQARRNVTPLLVGGGLVGILIVTACLLFAGISLRRMMANGDGGVFGVLSGSSPSATVVAVRDEPSVTPNTTPAPATPTPPAAPEATQSPATTAIFPLPSVPDGVQFVRIDNITLDEQGDYVVAYETFGYTEQLPGEHIHFFFNSVPPDQAGPPGKGPWYMYGGPRPFTGYKTSDRPEGATEICALVTNPDHSLHPESGNCYPLPDLNLVYTEADAPCLFGPGEAYPSVTTLKSGAVAPVEGLSPDESWWYVQNPDQPTDHCWVSNQATIFGGDVASLKLVEPPPAPTPTVVSTAPSVEITNISVDDQKHYAVEFVTHNYTPQLPGTHIHFFFNSTPADQVGLNGLGNRLMYGGPSPFTGYSLSNRPDNASKICALVANPDHTTQPDTGNCYALPDVPAGVVSVQSSCLEKPDPLASTVRDVNTGDPLVLLGRSVDGQWVYVGDGEDPSQACWIPESAATASGDVSQLRTMGANPTPTPKKKSDPKDYNY